MSDTTTTTTGAGGPTVDDILAVADDITTGAASPDGAPGLPPLPGMELLGCGYDVLGRSASPSSVGRRLFDFSAEDVVPQIFYDESLTADQLTKLFFSRPAEVRMTYARPQRVVYKSRFEADCTYSVEKSLQDEQRTLSASVGLSAEAGLFAGELHARYDTSTSRLVTTRYGSMTAVIRYYDLTLEGFPSPELHAGALPLLPDVRADLDDPRITPQEIFEAYGTHYTSKITIGAKVVYSHTVDTSKTTTAFEVAADLTARYSGVSGTVSGATTSSTAAESTAETVRVHSEGLTPEEDAEVKEEAGGEAAGARPNPMRILRSGWHNPVLIEIPKGGLQPIWKLCTTVERRSALEAALDPYLQEKAGAAVVGRPDLVPLYLLRLPHDPPRYRLAARAVPQPGDPAGAWEEVGGGAPWLYGYADPAEDRVPLYGWFFRTPASGQWRYETGSWDAWMQGLSSIGRQWRKGSSDPIAYVRDAVGEARPDDVDVVAYFPNDGGLQPRCYYSDDASDMRDAGGWHPATSADDLGPNTGLALTGEDSVWRRILMGGSPGVHWRATRP